jgi:hypothetical protein
LQRTAVRKAIDSAFVSTFRVLMLAAAALALASALFGSAITGSRRPVAPRDAG